MRLHRFYVSQPLGEEVVINDVSIINQWIKVLRYTIGSFVILFNGDGYEYTYSLRQVSKNTCTLTHTKKSSSYIPVRKISLFLSIIKKDNFELAVQKATELGVSTIIPIVSSRSEKKNISLERLHKIVRESAEQCGRGDLPIVSSVTSLAEALTLVTTSGEEAVVLNLEGKPLADALDTLNKKSISLFIGPEGGWSPEDLSVMKHNNLKEYSLGPTVLRAETAAIACSTLLLLS